jgi:hypothetical protein
MNSLVAVGLQFAVIGPQFAADVNVLSFTPNITLSNMTTPLPSNMTSNTTTIAPSVAPNLALIIYLRSLLLSSSQFLVALFPTITSITPAIEKIFADKLVQSIILQKDMIPNIKDSLSGMVNTFVQFFLALSIIVLLSFTILRSGKLQDYRRKRVAYYKHVQGLLLIRLLNQARGIVEKV